MSSPHNDYGGTFGLLGGFGLLGAGPDLFRWLAFRLDSLNRLFRRYR